MRRGFLLLALVCLTTPLRAAQIVVYNTNDSLAGSLRQAIQDANPAGGDTVVFQIPTSDPRFDAVNGIYPISLTSGPLVINKDLIIDARGQKIHVLRTAGSFSVVRIIGGTVRLQGLTIRDGSSNSGGGIDNAGDLTLTGCTFSGNEASSNAGAVYNNGSLYVSNCTFYGNRSFAGSAIYNAGAMSINNSTISGNNTTGGPFFAGALFNDGSAGPIAIRNCIVAANTGAPTMPGTDVAGGFASEGYNLVGFYSGGIAFGFGATGDQTNATPAQVNLGPFQDNGGPTFTLRPQPGSVAIDQGKRGLDAANQAINIDQRGYPRSVDLQAIPNAVGGDGSDIGAVETGVAQAGPAFTVTNTADHSDGCTTDDCTLLEAITAANANNDANTILFAPNVTGFLLIRSSFTGYAITQPVTILGPGARVLALTGENASRIFNISAPNVTISGLTFRSGRAIDQSGGAIYNGGGLTLKACAIILSGAVQFSGAEVDGGGLYSAPGTSTTLIGCTFASNFANSFGGGVYTEGALTATNCTFSGNTALRGGGLILRGTASITLRNCTFSGNTANDGVASPGFGGGGLFCEGAAAQHFIGNCLLAGNTATNDPDIRGNYTSDGHNFIGKIGDATGLTNGVNGNQIGTVAMPLNAQFGSFGNNGGPTDTWSLLANSPAINAGDNNLAPLADQRGYLRNGISDIGAFEFNGSVPPPVSLTSVVSRKTHTGVGPFDVNLPLAGGGIECRGASGNHTIIFTFANNLTSVGSAAITSGLGNISNLQIGADAHQCIVELTGVADAQALGINLNDVIDSLGNRTAAQPLTIGFLLGDANGDGFVNSADATITRNRSGQTSDATNFRADYNLDGFVNSADATIVRARSGQFIP